MSDEVFNVLFLCTGEFRPVDPRRGDPEPGRRARRFKAFSAGSHPKGEVHPLYAAAAEGLNRRPSFARSKSWEEFAAPGAPEMHFVFTGLRRRSDGSLPCLASASR